jgi:hypothetical protein
MCIKGVLTESYSVNVLLDFRLSLYLAAVARYF